jgi:hypothetical protein
MEKVAVTLGILENAFFASICRSAASAGRPRDHVLQEFDVARRVDHDVLALFV